MKNITIYTTNDCGPCNQALDYLKSKSLTFKEIDVTENESILKKLIKKSGYSVAPQIEIDGQMIVGFDKDKIDELTSLN